MQLYPSQTKILEAGTKADMRISKEALVKDVSTQFGARTSEKSCPTRTSALHLLFLLPKSWFGEHKVLHGIMTSFPTQIIAFCAYRCSYLRFSDPFRPRAETATFWLATLSIRTTSNDLGGFNATKSTLTPILTRFPRASRLVGNWFICSMTK